MLSSMREHYVAEIERPLKYTNVTLKFEKNTCLIKGLLKWTLLIWNAGILTNLIWVMYNNLQGITIIYSEHG